MEGIIANFRGGRHTQKNNEMVLIVSGIDSKEKAKALIGKRVEWTTQSGKKIEGEVTKTHGSKGAVLARFGRGMPGQSLGTKVEVEWQV